MSKKKFSSPENLFEITEILGEGSYGNVYKGISLKDKKTVAIKILPISEDISDLEKEIKILDQCDSPSIVDYYGCYQDRDNGDFWIVMEYCQAGSLSDLMGICNILIKENQLAVILKEVLLGLNYMHKNNLIHRDIKGGNILLNKKGHVKLTDFGVSVKLASTISKRNTVIGTPFWMAPEVLKENDYNNKADIWSLGITAIELAQGNPPYSNLHPMKAIFVIPSKPAPRLSSNFSKKFREFIKLCCNKDPKKRPSASQLLKHPFIRSAGSKSILKKLFDECYPQIKKFRETYDADSNDTTNSQTIRSKNKIDLENDDEDDDINPSGTVLINQKPITKNEIKENNETWEQNLKFDSEEEEDDYPGTIVVNKVKSNRQRDNEKFDFFKPRPLKEKLGGKSWHRDTFEFYGKVPKRGHKYVADYYTTLTLPELNSVLLEMENSFKKNIKSVKENYEEEKRIVEYAIRVKKGEQTVFIKD